MTTWRSFWRYEFPFWFRWKLIGRDWPERLAAGVRLFLVITLAVIAALLVTGCAGLGLTTRVEVPVGVDCNPPAIEAPSRPIDSLTPQANEFEFSRALWATLETLEGYTQHLEAAVAACRR